MQKILAKKFLMVKYTWERRHAMLHRLVVEVRERLLLLRRQLKEHERRLRIRRALRLVS